MILGVYWHFGFPTNLYKYRYFEFEKGLGGFMDAPGELITSIEVEDPKKLIDELKELVKLHEDSFLFIYNKDSRLRLGTGSYTLHDYDFEFMLKVEEILLKFNAKKTDYYDFKDLKPLRLLHENQTPTKPTKDYFYIVSSSMQKHNAQTTCIRLDCNLSFNKKDSFFEELKMITDLVNINVIYYLDKKIAHECNLMIFLTNGRQGKGLVKKQKINFSLLETKLDCLLSKYNVKIGHISGDETYPEGKPKIIKIIDQDFILGKRKQRTPINSKMFFYKLNMRYLRFKLSIWTMIYGDKLK